MSIRTTTSRGLGNNAEESTVPPLAPDTPFGALVGPADLDPSESVEEPTWNVPQVASVVAGAGAAATSTLVGGHLGVAGTVIGAAIASIVTTLAINVYDNTLRRAGHRVRLRVARLRRPETAAQHPAPSPPEQRRTRLRLSPRVLRWAALTAVLGTVLGLGLMVGLERSTAEPITPGTTRLAEAAPGSGASGVRDSSRTVPGPDARGATTEPGAVAPSANPSAAAAPDAATSDPLTDSSGSETGSAADTATDPGTLADAPAGTGPGTASDTGSGSADSGSTSTSTGDAGTP